MPNIAFIAGGELETLAEHLWTATTSFNSEAPASGVTGAHGKVYYTGTWPVLQIDCDATAIATGKTRFRFENSVDNEPFMHFSDGILEQVALVYRSNGSIQVVSNAVVLATSATGLFVIDTWYELECRVRIANGAGSIAVNRNGSQIICLPSGVDTQGTSNARITRWKVGSDELGAYFDDCALDRSGAYLGTGEVETLMPNGVGDVTQLIPGSIAANHTLVSEKPHDSDTSYVRSTGDQIDVYQFENRSVAGTPLAVMLVAHPRSETGNPAIKLVCRIDGENFESDAFSPILSSYDSAIFHVWNANPATGEAWSDAAINSAQFGVHCLQTGMRVSQVGLQVYVRSAESDECLASGASRDYCGSVSEDLN